MFRKLRTIIYHVDNLQKAKEWYQQVTGISPYFDESYYVGFNVYGCELGLDPDLSNASVGEHSVAYWLVDNIKDAMDNLTGNNAEIINPIQQVGKGIFVAVVKDPFGNHLGLIEETKGTT